MAEDKNVNIGLFGDKDVGKTALASRFTEKKFTKTATTTYLNMPVCKESVYGTEVQFSLYDVPGSPEYSSLAAGVYAGIEVAMLCYDVTNEASFNGLQEWVNKIGTSLPVSAVKMLIGCKTDLKRVVQVENARSFATQNGYIYFEVSSKANQKEVNEVFYVAAAKALNIAIPAPPELNAKGSSFCCFM